MLKTIKDFFDFAGKENKKKFIIAIWLSLLEAIGNALKVPAVMLVLSGLLHGSLYKNVLYAVIIMVISILISIITKAYISVLETDAGYGSIAYKRIEMAEHLRFVPMGYFNNNTIGEISSVMTNTMDGLSTVATRAIMVTTQGILETILVLIFLFIFDWRIGLIGLAGLAIFLLINRKLQSTGSDISEKKQACDTEMVSEIVEYLKGIAEVKSYGLFDRTARKFNAANQACCETNTKMELSYDPWFFLQSLTIRLTGGLIVAAATVFYLNGTMDVIIAIGMTICAFILFSGLEIFGSFSALFHLIRGYMDKASAVLNLPAMDIAGQAITPKDQTIIFDHVDFSYDKKKIIDDASMTIPAGQTTAFIGPSGSGKTTLAHLAARFWDADQGTVTLGGKNVKEYQFDSLMDNYSFVFQNVYLFADTIENNIKFGKEDATHEEVVQAARLACCDAFIHQLHDGYETIIQEGGTSLSGGEKQRLSIARAIIKDAPIIILDEATANVDPENEEDLMKAIQALTKNKTVIMIAHRLKTVRHAAKILVIDKGKVIDAGTHEELIKKDGLYKTFIEAREHAINWQIAGK